MFFPQPHPTCWNRWAPATSAGGLSLLYCALTSSPLPAPLRTPPTCRCPSQVDFWLRGVPPNRVPGPLHQTLGVSAEVGAAAAALDRQLWPMQACIICWGPIERLIGGISPGACSRHLETAVFLSPHREPLSHKIENCCLLQYDNKDFCASPARDYDFDGPQYIHHATLTGLTPGARYNYRVGGREGGRVAVGAGVGLGRRGCDG